MTRAIVLVVVVFVVAVLVLRHTGSTASGHATAAPKVTTTTSTVPPTTTTTTRSPFIPPSRTTVQVLNGLLSGDLAGNLSTRLVTDGYKTLAAENTTTATDTTVIYVANSSYFREGVALALELKLTRDVVKRTIPPTAPIPAGLAARSDLVVIIGSSLQTLASSA